MEKKIRVDIAVKYDGLHFVILKGCKDMDVRDDFLQV